MTEDELVRYLHQLNGHESKQAPGDNLRTEESGTLQSMGSRRVRHNFATEQEQQPQGSSLFLSPEVRESAVGSGGGGESGSRTWDFRVQGPEGSLKEVFFVNNLEERNFF